MTFQADTHRPPEVVIGRLRVSRRGTGPLPDVPALRLRLERLLGQVGLEPPDLPPGAVLIVRELRGLRPVPQAGSVPAEWSGAVRGRLAGLYRAAARPAAGHQAGSAASAFFGDWSELLACLTRDVAAGRAWQQWYWQQVLRDAPRAPGPALAAMWSRHAAALPAALAALPRREAAWAVGLLGAAELAHVIRSLHAAFELPSTAPAPAAGGPSAGRGAPPWARWLPGPPLPADGQPAPPEAEYLLGLSLALYHAPAFARSAMFAGRAAGWLAGRAAAVHARPAGSLRDGDQIREAATGDRTGPRDAAAGRADISPPARDPPASPAADRPVEGAAPQPPAVSGRTRPETGAPGAPFPANARETSAMPFAGDAGIRSSHSGLLSHGDEQSAATDDRNVPSGLLEADGTRVAAGAAAPVEAGPLSAPDGLPTFLGGALYLANLLAWLDLPGDGAGCTWDRPAVFAEGLGSWGTVEVLARGLLGAHLARHAADPLWAALAALDARAPGVPAGLGLPQPTAFGLPAAWLRRYGPRTPRWLGVAGARRVRLFDGTAGYLVADLPWTGGDPARVAAAAVAGYRAQGVGGTWRWASAAGPQHAAAQFHAGLRLEPGLSEAMGPAAAWWLARVRGFTGYLLARAVRRSRDAGPWLLRRRGTLLLSRTHVDLYLPLAAVDVAIRRCGLDRDPGWAPDLAHIVLFHFV